MITSFSNPLIKRIKRLRHKKYRDREQSHFVEGIRIVKSAVEADAQIETLLYSSELLTSKIAWRLIEDQQSAGRQCVELTPSLFESVSGRDNPVGLGAIVKSEWKPINEFQIRPNDLYVTLVDIAEPGNLGAIFRTSDAAGVSGLILVGSTVDPFHPGTIKASMGTLYSVPFTRISNPKALFDWTASHNIYTVATTSKGGSLHWQLDTDRPATLIIGSEREGLSKQVLDAADQTVSIPMRGVASSLNIAVATGVILYEMTRDGLDIE